MESNLRPLTLSEILDLTAQLYRTNFVLFAGIFAVYAGVALVLNLLLIGVGQLLKALHMTGSLAWVTLIATGIELLFLFLLLGAAVAAISRAVAWVHLGKPATIRGAYTSILPRVGRYLWLMTIAAFAVWLPMLITGMASKLRPAQPPNMPPRSTRRRRRLCLLSWWRSFCC